MLSAPEQTVAPVRVRFHEGSLRLGAAIEALAVLLAPGLLYAVLRLRGMAPSGEADPGIHTGFILDPHDTLARYHDVLASTARLREAARVGFIVPARVSALLFGPVPGFFVLRYALALIAIVPVYLLLRRMYGRWAGAIGIAVIMSSPVVVTAWGTDYPDSAAVSYLTGGLAALALSLDGPESHRGWLTAAGVLLTLAVWAFGVSVPLVIVAVAVYAALRLRRQRARLARDIALLGGSAVVVTVVLALLSKALIGQLDFITPTVQSIRFLARADQIQRWHSSNAEWALYVPYILVPPAVVAAFIALFAGRWRTLRTPLLMVGAGAVLQVTVFAIMQFLGSVQTLEMHFFSSTLWSSVNIVLALLVAEISLPIVGSVRERWRPEPALALARPAIPALIVLAVALAYEAAVKLDLRVGAINWIPWGIVVAAAIPAAVLAGRFVGGAEKRAAEARVRARAPGALRAVAAACAVLAVTGAAMVLTVARRGVHAPLAHTVWDPIPSYDNALGGNDTAYVDEYTVVSKLPAFVGHATYPHEHLLTWEPPSQFGDLQEAMGVYHNAATWVSTTFPVLVPSGVKKIESWQAGQVLLMSLTGEHFGDAVRSLAQFEPRVVRRAVIARGWYRLHVWLIDLERYTKGR